MKTDTSITYWSESKVLDLHQKSKNQSHLTGKWHKSYMPVMECY